MVQENTGNVKQVPVRIPVELWRKCMHRMVDEERGSFQALIIECLEAYAAGEPVDVRTPSK